jgi:hypothetical protein
MLGDFPGEPLWFILGLPFAILVWIACPSFVVYLVWRAGAQYRSPQRFLKIPEHLAREIASLPEATLESPSFFGMGKQFRT